MSPLLSGGKAAHDSMGNLGEFVVETWSGILWAGTPNASGPVRPGRRRGQGSS